MGTIKDRNGRDLTQAEDIRGGRNTQRTMQKNLHDPDSHDAVIAHLEPTSWNMKSSGP